MHIEMRRGKTSKKESGHHKAEWKTLQSCMGCKYITSECGRFDYWGLGGWEEVCMHGV